MDAVNGLFLVIILAFILDEAVYLFVPNMPMFGQRITSLKQEGKVLDASFYPSETVTTGSSNVCCHTTIAKLCFDWLFFLCT